MGWGCDVCYRTFGSAHALSQHRAALGHWESPFKFSCHRCASVFRTQSDAAFHMDSWNHWKHACSRCTMTASSDDEVKEHEISDHFWCSKCDREFQNHNNIKMHLNSRVHLGTSIKCPCCLSPFTTATGLAHHLETGGCPRAARLDRDGVYNIVRSLDQDGLIAKKLIGWQGSTTYEATERSWNGDSYECYFCAREFNTLSSLNQHLQSPVHQQKLYHCLNRGGCGKEFTTLAGVCNHLESETCGVMRFQTVQRHFQGLMRGDRMIAYR
ncbi:hypothetical protein F5Y14DRAFT_400053 [Nemania sp. NC0429]|nr:hypothetical protein F5Y14DRAFT_400053 [Nemania sp. NC0429]